MTEPFHLHSVRVQSPDRHSWILGTWKLALVSLVSYMSPSWHSQLLRPAQLIQEGFFSSSAMYCNSC